MTLHSLSPNSSIRPALSGATVSYGERMIGWSKKRSLIGIRESAWILSSRSGAGTNVDTPQEPVASDELTAMHSYNDARSVSRETLAKAKQAAKRCAKRRAGPDWHTRDYP